MKVHYLQHVVFEGLGYIETWLKQNNHDISATQFFDPNHNLPEVETVDALIILGGPMGVYDEHQYPWLAEEMEFIQKCVLAGKKVLGICLGAQLIATCLGAGVHMARHKEIGWYRVRPTEDCAKLSWFYNLFKNSPVVFHWHGDQFSIPAKDALNLLTSDANANQAFMYKDHVLGLQFHLETTSASILEMLDKGADDISVADFVQSKEDIIKALSYPASTNNIADQLLNHFLV